MGYLCWRRKRVSIAILGLVGGYFLGCIVYTIGLAFGWKSVSGMLVISIVFALCGLAATFIWPYYVVPTCTSGIGSYIYMRGWAYILGGYPSESQIIKDLRRGNEPDLDNVFWIYMAFFAHCWMGSYYYQYVKNYSNDSDDNWNSA